MRILAIIIVFVFISCSPQPYFERVQNIETQGWTYAKTLDFDVDIINPDQIYNLQLIIDHSTSYKYQNIYLNIKTVFPEQEDKLERLSIDLADHKGKWIGKCQGESCQTRVYLLDNFKFPTAGKFGFELSQETRDSTLMGISALTLQLFEQQVASS